MEQKIEFTDGKIIPWAGFPVAKGIWVTETTYQTQNWDTPRRMNMVRQNIENPFHGNWKTNKSFRL